MIIITIEQVRYFLALKQYNSFSVASEELCISQFSLSKHIKTLENELGTSLFNRNTRSVSLTTAGEEFYQYALKFLKDYEDIFINMKKYSNDNLQSLKIGAIPVLAQYSFTTSIALFKNDYPYIDINIIEDESDNIVNLLLKNEVDFAIVREFSTYGYKFDTLPLVNDNLVVVTSKNHPLSKQDFISLADLKDEEFIMLGNKSGIHNICVNECNKFGFYPKIAYSISKIETILGLVSENFGIKLLMSKVIGSFNNSAISITPLKEYIASPLVLAYNKDSRLSDEAIEFKNYMVSNLSK